MGMYCTYEQLKVYIAGALFQGSIYHCPINQKPHLDPRDTNSICLFKNHKRVEIRKRVFFW